MLMMSPFCRTRLDGRGLPKICAGFAIGVEPMMRKSMSPPPSRMAAPAAARSSYSFTPGLAYAVEFFGAVEDDEVMQEVLGEHQFDAGQFLAQRVVLIDRHVVGMAR